METLKKYWWIGLILVLAYFGLKKRKLVKYKMAKRKLNKYNQGFYKAFKDEDYSKTGSVYSRLKRGNY